LEKLSEIVLTMRLWNLGLDLNDKELDKASYLIKTLDNEYGIALMDVIEKHLHLQEQIQKQEQNAKKQKQCNCTNLMSKQLLNDILVKFNKGNWL